MIQCTKLCKNENMHINDIFLKKDTKMHQPEMVKIHKEYQCMKYTIRFNIKIHQVIRIAQK